MGRATAGRSARVAHPAFRWLPSDAVRLTFNEWVRVIQPDVTLELPAQQRRCFLECEMGGHTISPGLSKPPGATLSIERSRGLPAAETAAVARARHPPERHLLVSRRESGVAGCHGAASFRYIPCSSNTLVNRRSAWKPP
jgi:hypothetical protein